MEKSFNLAAKGRNGESKTKVTQNIKNKTALHKLMLLVLATLYFLLPLLYSPYSNDIFKLPKIVFFQVCSFGAFTLFLQDLFARKNFKPFKGNSVITFTGLFIATILFSFLFAKSNAVAMKDFLLLGCAMLLLFVLSAQERKALTLLCLLSLLSAFLVACTGILQHFDHDITGISARTGVPASFMASTLGHRNYIAELLCMTLPFGIYFYLSSEKPLVRALYFAAVSMMFLSLLITNSRSGWLSFGLSALFFYPS